MLKKSTEKKNSHPKNLFEQGAKPSRYPKVKLAVLTDTPVTDEKPLYIPVFTDEFRSNFSRY